MPIRAGSPHPYASKAASRVPRPESPIANGEAVANAEMDKAAKAYIAAYIAVERSTAEHFAQPGLSPPTAIGTSAEDLEWLEENAKAPGVITLPSGLQYKVLKAAAPRAKSPKIGTRCEVRYKGTLVRNGFEFYNSTNKSNPSGLEGHTPNRIIRGWTLALQLMGTGDKWRLFMPSELGYGDAGSTKNCWMGVPPGAALCFDIELCTVRHDSGKPEGRPGGILKVPRPEAMTLDEFEKLYAEGGGTKPGSGPDMPYMGGHFDRAALVLRTRAILGMIDGVAAAATAEATQERERLRAALFAMWGQRVEQLEGLDGAECFPSKHAKTIRRLQADQQRLQRENHMMRQRLVQAGISPDPLSPAHGMQPQGAAVDVSDEPMDEQPTGTPESGS